jgi:hypothetical protein
MAMVKKSNYSRRGDSNGEKGCQYRVNQGKCDEKRSHGGAGYKEICDFYGNNRGYRNLIGNSSGIASARDSLSVRKRVTWQFVNGDSFKEYLYISSNYKKSFIQFSCLSKDFQEAVFDFETDRYEFLSSFGAYKEVFDLKGTNGFYKKTCVVLPLKIQIGNCLYIHYFVVIDGFMKIKWS